TAAADNLFGTAGAAYTQLGAPLRNVMWGGNASGNAIIRFFGSNGPGPQNASDRDAILADIGGGQSTIITGQYKKADVNMNRITRFIGNNGPGVQNTSDRDWLLSQALGGAQGNIRTQSLPGN
ncbi:MAG TPA: hypothetical protein PKD90_20065, partial [Phnomibacter sp.]|nr:hypothetical protein [Phnomibacter sp.]